MEARISIPISIAIAMKKDFQPATAYRHERTNQCGVKSKLGKRDLLVNQSPTLIPRTQNGSQAAAYRYMGRDFRLTDVAGEVRQQLLV
jgi:hypothetical protein